MHFGSCTLLFSLDMASPNRHKLACVTVACTVSNQQLIPLKSQAGGKLHVPAGPHSRHVGQPADEGETHTEVLSFAGQQADGMDSILHATRCIETGGVFNPDMHALLT